MATTESHSAPIPYTTAHPVSASTAQGVGEWRRVAWVIAIALLLTSAPYVFANAAAPADKQFMGMALNVNDHIQYFSWMRDLSTANLAADRLTPEPNQPALFNLLWWSLGRFGSITGLDYAALYTVLRVLAALVCLCSVYAFLRIVTPERRQRQTAFVLIAFGSGLGVVWIVLKYLPGETQAPFFPFDVYTAEPNTFLSLMGYPHFALALGLLVGTFALLLVALQKRQLRYAVAAGGVALILGLQHAYDLVTIYAALGLFGVLTWLRDRRFPRFLFVCGLIVVGMSVFPAAYSLLLAKADPVWGAVLSQFDLAGAFTPDPLHLPILLGIPFLLALFAFRPRMLRSSNDVDLFVAAWFVSHFLLVYLPLDFQIHLLLGWQVPIAILAASALGRVTSRSIGLAGGTRIRPGIVVSGLIALSLITNVYLLAWRFVELRRFEPPYFLTKDHIAALDWLASRATAEDVVLAELELGQFVPMWSDARAFLAHWTGTLDYPNKVEMVSTVLSADSPDAERLAILTEFDVSYIIAGGQLGQSSGPTLAAAPYLTPVFARGPVTIYRYRAQPAP